MDEISSPRPDLEAIRNPDTDFERSDLSVRVIGLVGLGLAFLIALSPVVLLYGFAGIGSDVSRKLQVLPPQPRLQTHPASDLEAELARQRARLNSYGWIDRAHDIARVPISEAMKRAAESGLAGFPVPESQRTQSAALSLSAAHP
jgi:hypothetical protein